MFLVCLRVLNNHNGNAFWFLVMRELVFSLVYLITSVYPSTSTDSVVKFMYFIKGLFVFDYLDLNMLKVIILPMQSVNKDKNDMYWL